MQNPKKLQKVTKRSRKQRDGTEFDKKYLEVVTSLKAVEEKPNRDEQKI
jgi:hypothetical protein